MKYLDEFREPELAQRLLQRIRATASRKWNIMEVCGGQTHGLVRYGIETELFESVRFLHGPGCPVCVTPPGLIDAATALCRLENVVVCSFGDMLRVPGSRESLLTARAHGGQVRIVYSPLDAVEWARTNPARQVVFFAVGFETTAPATALAVVQAQKLGLKNFSLLTAHVRVLPAMRQLLRDENPGIDGFLAAGHVCAITGAAEYPPFSRQFGLPVVVTGFEPIDLLTGILECVNLLESGSAAVVNCYGRTVSEEGNTHARQIIDEVFEPCDLAWRGFGDVPDGGMRLRPAYHRWDALRRFESIAATLPDIAPAAEPSCPSGLVLTGKLHPRQCPYFGRQCTPDQPLGAPMVSSEGACAAYFRYGDPLMADVPLEAAP